jgi:hypothetical protein
MSRPVGGTRTTLGPQVSSKRASAPNYGFGTCTRETQDKVFISQEHAALVGDSCSPGPVYDQRPAIGPQVNGAMTSAPLFGFGKSTRDTAQKVFISKEHADKVAAPYSPGPIYLLDASIGPQANGAIASAPLYGFGTSTRDHQQKVFVSAEHNTINDYGKASPGPAAPYKLKSGMGAQVQTFGPSPYAAGGSRGVRNSTQPAWVMGKAERFAKDRSAWVPGAGEYKLTPAVGPQVNGRLKSSPLYGFGSSNRDHMAKVYISSEHEKYSGGRDAPGPGQYAIKSLTGNPVVSGHQVSGSRWGFGTGKRFTDEFKHQKGNPGPGHYVI